MMMFYFEVMCKFFDLMCVVQLQIVFKFNWIFSYCLGGSIYGSLYCYDIYVFLLFWGLVYVGQGEVKICVEMVDLVLMLVVIVGLFVFVQVQGYDLQFKFQLVVWWWFCFRWFWLVLVC